MYVATRKWQPVCDVQLGTYRPACLARIASSVSDYLKSPANMCLSALSDVCGEYRFSAFGLLSGKPATAAGSGPPADGTATCAGSAPSCAAPLAGWSCTIAYVHDANA